MERLQIELEVVAEDSTYSLRDGEFDLAIDLNDGTYPGQSTVLLEEETSSGVLAAPARRPPAGFARGPAALPAAARHDGLGSPPYAEWERYLKATRAPQVEVRRGYMFNCNHITMQCAIAGMLGWRSRAAR